MSFALFCQILSFLSSDLDLEHINHSSFLVEQTRKESQQVPKVQYEKVAVTETKYVPQVEYVDVELTRYEHVPRITYVDVPTRTFQHIPQVEYETRLLTVPRFGVEYQQHNRDVRYPVKQFWPEVVEAPKATSSY